MSIVLIAVLAALLYFLFYFLSVITGIFRYLGLYACKGRFYLIRKTGTTSYGVYKDPSKNLGMCTTIDDPWMIAVADQIKAKSSDARTRAKIAMAFAMQNIRYDSDTHLGARDVYQIPYSSVTVTKATARIIHL